MWRNRPEHLKLTTQAAMISTVNLKDLGLLSRRATRHICGGLSWLGQGRPKIHALVSGAVPWARVPGWVPRTKLVEDQHSSPSTIWLQMQCDQLPSAPATMKDCTHKMATKMSPLTLKLLLCFIFAFYHNVQSNRYPLATYSSSWIS